MLPSRISPKGGRIVTVAVRDVEPLVARMVASPGASPVITPDGSTDATVGVSLDQLIDPEGVTIADAGRLPPTATDPGV
jgi:hypothetical protein